MPMKALIVFAHPSHDSYNYQILIKLREGLEQNGHETQLRDLYSMSFDPVMSAREISGESNPLAIAREQERIKWANIVFFVFPIWWWGPPAILKGWLERVLCLGFAFKYNIEKNALIGTLQNRKAVVISTGASSPEKYTEVWQLGAHSCLVSSILTQSGFSVIEQMNFYDIHQYTPRDLLTSYLQEVFTFAAELE